MLGAGQLCVLYVPMKGFFFSNVNRKDCHQIKCNIKIIAQRIKRRSLNSTANIKRGTDGQTFLLTYLPPLDQFVRNRPRIFEALDFTSLTCVPQCTSSCYVKAVNLVLTL